ncbi:MAG: exodeoxyribonuclease VII large subunit [Gammaproteobacteria bacterium]
MFTSPLDTPQREVFSVSRLNREARALVEGHFPLIWVEGELSNLARPSSGHLYFTLKDEQAQVRCAMFKLRNQLLGFKPDNGMQVLARARVSLYEGRGEFQLLIEHLEEAGDGALRRAFEQLKHKLAAEGLFDATQKKPLPSLPRCIGVITSPSGAALRDILSVLRRRFPALPVLVYPVPVQGQGAGEKIAAAIRLAAQRRDCDVLIVSRGGGSLEDLWAFNEEVVARAIHACDLPIISGVGHEIDFTIADFVADHRAATPSAAAELVSPDQTEWLAQLRGFELRFTQQLRTLLARHRQGLAWLEQRLQQQAPQRRLANQTQRLDELETRLKFVMQTRLRQQFARLAHSAAQLQRHAPAQRLAHLRTHAAQLTERLRATLCLRLAQRRGQLTSLVRALDAVSPLATLSRGYALVTRADGRVVRRVSDVQIGERIDARLAEGVLICHVDDVNPE